MNTLLLFLAAPMLGFWDFISYFGYFLLLLAILFTAYAQFKVHSTFTKYSRVETDSGMTGAEAAELVLRQNGVRGVRVERVHGKLSDHYDPRSQVIRLSDEVYAARTPAAIGVAAHEAGHAVQYAEEYIPVKLRTAIIPATNLLSRFSAPLLLLGIFLDIMGFYFAGIAFIWIGIIAFSASVLFQLVTLPCEFNASRRAMAALAEGGFSERDKSGARRVLSAAAMTYVAALFVSLIYLLRYIALARSRRR